MIRLMKDLRLVLWVFCQAVWATIAANTIATLYLAAIVAFGLGVILLLGGAMNFVNHGSIY